MIPTRLEHQRAEQDKRCPLPQSIYLYTELKNTNILLQKVYQTTVYIQFILSKANMSIDTFCTFDQSRCTIVEKHHSAEIDLAFGK